MVKHIHHRVFPIGVHWWYSLETFRSPKWGFLPSFPSLLICNLGTWWWMAHISYCNHGFTRYMLLRYLGLGRPASLALSGGAYLSYQARYNVFKGSWGNVYQHANSVQLGERYCYGTIHRVLVQPLFPPNYIKRSKPLTLKSLLRVASFRRCIGWLILGGMLSDVLQSSSLMIDEVLMTAYWSDVFISILWIIIDTSLNSTKMPYSPSALPYHSTS